MTTSAATPAPDPVNRDARDRERSRQGGELNLGLCHLLSSPLPDPPDVACRADPLGQRVDGAGEILPSAFDLSNDLIRVALSHFAVRRGSVPHRNGRMLAAALLIGHPRTPSRPERGRSKPVYSFPGPCALRTSGPPVHGRVAASF